MSDALNLLDQEETLLPVESVEDPMASIDKEKPANIKTANDERKGTETDKIVESENLEFPPVLLDSFKTKAVLAKVINFLYFVYIAM